jgi:hypothetical protein
LSERGGAPTEIGGAMSYRSRVKHQIEQYRDLDRLKKLPPIYRYWAQEHLAPAIEGVFGTRNIYALYAGQFTAAMERQQNTRRILSIGAGECRLEVDVAKHLKAMDVGDFVIDCTELSAVRLARGRERAEREGVSEHLEFLEVDLNEWATTRRYAAVMAQHTLHHIVQLETLFEAVSALLDDEGVFVTIDMIGRNGHMRWPETLAWVERIWAFMPDRYKYNHQFEKRIDPYLNWDCAKKGFEGIRAQDILPLLLANFSFAHFVGVGGIIDPFIDRAYGHNFDVEKKEDRAFIDFVHHLNAALIDTGVVKPTMVFAAMRKKTSDRVETVYHRNWSPEFCLRDPAL